MSGPRPLHQFRRGAIYAVRFRVPADLVERLGTTELSRSLRTADPRLARRLTNEATAWFRQTMEQVRAMPEMTRGDLNAAGDAYFAKLARDAMVAERLDPSQVDLAAAEQIGASQARITALSDQFRALSFDPSVQFAAAKIATKAGASFAELSPELQAQALHLAARAQREQMHLFIHSFENPGENFAASLPSEAWPVGIAENATVRPSLPPPKADGPTLQAAVQSFLTHEQKRGLSLSSMTEISRALRWLVEALGAESPVVRIGADNLRDVRDGLQRLDVRQRGKQTPFSERQTLIAKHQIAPQTASRLWASVCSFFRYLTNERHISVNPSEGISTVKPVHTVKRTPPPFTEDEIRRLLKSPMYGGHSARSLLKPGDRHDRGSYWWSGMLGLFTGMRAGEIAQLEPNDFSFDAFPPAIHVRQEGAEDKTLKTAASTRDIPISDELLALGLQALVEERGKGVSNRLFPDVPLGQRDRKSDGLTKFWSRYLRDHGLWKPGRATHVFRHTFTQAVRDGGASEEVIRDLLGHAPESTTARYGGGRRPIQERSQALSAMVYGVDIPTFIDCIENSGP